MTQALEMRDTASIIEQALVHGNLSDLSSEERVAYYRRVCDSLGLNAYTKPFEYLQLDGKLVLYARKDCTDQLRDINKVSITRLERERIEGLFVVTAYAENREGRQDSAIGAVPVEKELGTWKTNQQGKRYFESGGTFAPLKGEALANAMMKAETKAKRRVTLSLCGLGMLDESELEGIPDARVVETEIPPPAPRQPVPKPIRAPVETNDPELRKALADNVVLFAQADEAGVINFRRFKAEPSWSLMDVMVANDELRERIQSHQEL